MSVKIHIERLTKQEKRQLAHAFDNGFSQYIEFGDNEFVAVHLDQNRTKHLHIIEQTGVWSYGTTKK